LPGYADVVSQRCAHPSARQRLGNDTEVLSDLAAASLLLPTAHFAWDLFAASFGLDTVTKLADTYEASLHATAYRFVRFWPEPVLLAVLEPGLRKAERDNPSAQPKLRVRSVYSNSGWPYIPRNKSAAEGGPLHRAWQGELIRERSDLNDLDVPTPWRLELSAGVFPYMDAAGQLRKRVLALYRQLPQAASVRLAGAST